MIQKQSRDSAPQVLCWCEKEYCLRVQSRYLLYNIQVWAHAYCYTHAILLRMAW